MTETFEVGQKVQHDVRGELEVTYGPFRGLYVHTAYLAKGANDTEILVKADALSAIPEPPKFAVGDKVTSTAAFRGEEGTLVAGPFAASYGVNDFWVMEVDGKHQAPVEATLTKVTESAIKVGDRVRVLAASYADDDHGKVGTALGVNSREEFDGIRHPFYVDLGDGNTVYASAVERVEDENAYTYNGVTYDLSAKYRDKDGDVWEFTRFGVLITGAMNGTPANDAHRTLDSVVDAYGPLTRV
ncbi:phiSA1p31-related protein [Streptomyces sp. NPDC057927]